MRGFIAFTLILTLFTACQESFDHKCMREAQEYTRKLCPQKVDENITLDSTSYHPANRTYCYFYSISRKLNQKQVETNIKRQGQNFSNKLLLELVNSVEMKPYKDEKINFSFVYCMSNSRTPLLTILFTPKDYRK